MDNLFEALLALPEIDKYEWDVCLFLLSDLHKKTAAKFTQTLNQPEFLDLKSSLKEEGEPIKTFLTMRDKIGSLCHTWYMILGIAWFQETKKQITAEDALSLIIEFLPNEPDQLEKLKFKLDEITKIEELGRNGFYFTLFKSALMTKIEPKKSFSQQISGQNSTDISFKYMDNLLNTCKRIKEESDLNGLRFATLNYLNFLKNKITPTLTKMHYNAKKREGCDGKTSIHALLKSIKQGKCAVLTNDKSFIYDLEKYFYVVDIWITIFKECPTKDMVDKFNKHYHPYIDVMNASLSLTRQPYRFNNKNLNFFTLNHLLPSKEKAFLVKANEHVNQKKAIEKSDLSEFIRLTDNYKDELELKIKELAAQHFYYKKGNLFEDNFFTELLNDIQTNDIPILFLNIDILLLTEKYLIVNDIECSLSRKNTDELYEKLAHHSDFLNRKVESSGVEKYFLFGGLSMHSLTYFSLPKKTEETGDAEQDFVKSGNKVMTETADVQALFFPKTCA